MSDKYAYSVLYIRLSIRKLVYIIRKKLFKDINYGKVLKYNSYINILVLVKLKSLPKLNKIKINHVFLKITSVNNFTICTI